MFNIIKRHRRRDLKSINKALERDGFVQFEGKLQVTASKKGKVFHVDEGSNVVTIWAKHATMHLLTGESFSTRGQQRTFDVQDNTAHTATSPGEGTNKDGTLLSGQQYFSNNTNPNFNIDARWSKSTITPSIETADGTTNVADVRYPFFPSKMLFGTGFEFPTWASIPAQYREAYEDQGWDSSLFGTQTSQPINTHYSNTYSGATLVATRSMNDIFPGPLTSPIITEEDFGVSGAIKSGIYESSADSRHALNAGGAGSGTIRTYSEGGNEFLIKEWAGVGKPCFLYARRELRFFQGGSEVQLSADSNIENKIALTVVMPEQTGTQAGIFYPYNGYSLKVAGLFCDAKFLLNNTTPTGIGDIHPTEQANFNRMSHGIMFAKRYISPIEKVHNVSISARWILYL